MNISKLSKHVVLKGGTILDPVAGREKKGDIHIVDGKIKSVGKVDDALNLAIVFHQHQPYYKNKLTGMYEMPWVRVHGMTEYVDSPGILSKTGTKVTYNLVPSFIEQLVDYHRNETLDVHTDIAKRSWANGGYPNATDLELNTMQFQSFWNSGWIYNVTQEDTKLGWLFPSSSRYKELYDETLHNLKPATIMDDDLLPAADFLDLQVLVSVSILSRLCTRRIQPKPS